MRKNPSLEKNLEKGKSSISAPAGSPARSSARARTNATLVLLDGDYSGRDEMNLAGNPFALLQSSRRSGQTHIRYEWERRLPNGKIVTASWEVNGHERLGLPGPTEEKLYLVLLQLTREAGSEAEPWPRQVPFACGDVLRRMGWSDNASSYRDLRDSFTRLQTVAIQADHTFYDARSKTFYKTVGLGVLGDFAIAVEPGGRKKQSALPLSWFAWEIVLHTSIQTGNVRNLALDFTLSLEVPTALRLFRFLDMMRHATKPPRHDFTIGLLKLRDRLGMIDYKYPSKIKEKLQAAHNELIERGFLASVEYIKGKDGTDMAFYRFGDVKITAAMDEPDLAPSNGAALTSGETGRAHETGRAGQVVSARLISAPAIGEPPDSVVVNQCELRPKVAHAVFQALPPDQQERLRKLARAEVQPVFWDRLEAPDSPMALGLWQLVVHQFPELYAAQLDPQLDPQLEGRVGGDDGGDDGV